jgi:PAS domain S-box-containing protein
MPGRISTATARVEQLDLATVIAVWQAVSGEIVLEKLLEVVMRTAIEHAGAQRGLLLLPHGSELRINAEASTDGDAVRVRIEEQVTAPGIVPISILRYVARTREHVIIADASAENPFLSDDYLVSKRVLSVLCLPLLKRGELIAVLYLENNFAPNVFIPARVEILKLLAEAAAISLEKSRLYYEVQEREAERRRTEEQLRRTAAYLADAQKLAHTGAWASDSTTQPLYWSEEVFRIFGFDPQQGLPRWDQPLERIHPEDRERFWQAFQKTIQEKVDGDLEYRVALPDGTVKYIHAVGHPVLNPNGELVEAVGTIVDITERKRAEEELRATETRFRTIVDHAADALFVQDLEQQRIVDVNRRACESLGYSREELLGKPLLDFDAGISRAVWGGLRDRIGAGETVTFESCHRRKDGTLFAVEVSVSPFVQDSCRLVLAVARDITERKKAEEVVRQSEQQLRDIIETIPVMAFTALPDGATAFVNRGWLDFTGLTADAAGLYQLNSIHPEDREANIAKWQASLAGNGPFENEVRHRGVDGQYRWFLVRGVPLRDEHGKVLKWFGTLTDIEDRKKAEERIRNENVALHEEIEKASIFEDVVGASPALRGVLAAACKVAPMDATVLITGETGTGKELLARVIHKKSPRSARPFVSVNCAAIPQALIASELFGHEKGAFTGAFQRRLGRFELAEGGTIFLDEVGDLPLDTQIALLRVLQEKEFERVGGSHPIRSDARIIAATNRDLGAAMAAGTFRRDLFYRLSVFPIRVPPLRERREDISLLVEYFTHRFARKANKSIKTIEKRTLQLLQSFSWPGNVRELQNLIERAVIICETDSLTVDPTWLSSTQPEPRAASESLARRSAAEERQMIERALSEAQGKVAGPSGAAAKLGVPASTLESKIRFLKIDKYHYRKPPGAE